MCYINMIQLVPSPIQYNNNKTCIPPSLARYITCTQPLTDWHFSSYHSLSVIPMQSLQDFGNEGGVNKLVYQIKEVPILYEN